MGIKHENSIAPVPTPKIDEQFWYDLSAEWVKEAFKRIDLKANNLRNAINWFFGLGSTGTFASIFLDILDLPNKNQIALLGIPIFLFMVGYACAVMSQTTSYLGEFYAESYTTIKDAYNNMIKRSKQFIILGSISAFLGFASYPIFLISQLEIEKTDNSIKLESEYLKANVIFEKNRIEQVACTGKTAPSQNINVSVYSGFNYNSKKLLIRNNYITDTLGQFIVSINMPEETKSIKPGEKVFVKLEYKKNEIIYSIVQTIINN